MKKAIYILSILTLGFSCSETSNTDPKFVVEGFLFAGERVDDIRVKEQIGIEEADSIQRLITDAEVILTKNGQTYPLIYENGNYKYLDDDLTVSSGDLFRIDVTVGDRTAYAETIVPQPTEGLNLSSAEVIVPEIELSFSLINELTELFFSARITAKWNNLNEQLHFIVIEPALELDNPIYPEEFPQDGRDFLSGFRFAPSVQEEDTFSIVALSFEDYGLHRVKVFRVNQEYADLFNNPQQDSRDLTQPPTNIVNGFGVFSAFAADSAFFEIRRD